MPAPCKRGSRKAKDKATDSDPPLARQPQLHASPMPASYAKVVGSAVNTNQPVATPNQKALTLSITEITVLHSGGFTDTQLEQSIRAWAADAIV